MSWRGRTMGVDYVIGVARNAGLEAKIARQLRCSRSRAAVTGRKSRRFRSFTHRTRSRWSRVRRVIGKAEALPGSGAPKPNARFIVIALPASGHSAKKLYEDYHCARGDAENRAKDLNTGLFADRSPSNLFGAGDAAAAASETRGPGPDLGPAHPLRPVQRMPGPGGLRRRLADRPAGGAAENLGNPSGGGTHNKV